MKNFLSSQSLCFALGILAILSLLCLFVRFAGAQTAPPTYSTGTMYLETQAPTMDLPPLSDMQKNFERLEQFEQYLRDRKDPRRATNFL